MKPQGSAGCRQGTQGIVEHDEAQAFVDEDHRTDACVQGPNDGRKNRGRGHEVVTGLPGAASRDRTQRQQAGQQRAPPGSGKFPRAIRPGVRIRWEPFRAMGTHPSERSRPKAAVNPPDARDTGNRQRTPTVQGAACQRPVRRRGPQDTPGEVALPGPPAILGSHGLATTSGLGRGARHLGAPPEVSVPSATEPLCVRLRVPGHPGGAGAPFGTRPGGQRAAG